MTQVEREETKTRRVVGKKWKIAIIVVLAICLLFPPLKYLAHYAYWGRRHAVLWDVKKVTVNMDDRGSDNNTVLLTYDVSVKNWPHDSVARKFQMTTYLTGEPCIWDFAVDSDGSVTSTREEKDYTLTVRFNLSSVIPYDAAPTVKDVIDDAIHMTRFMPYLEVGDQLMEDEKAMLYLEDFPDVEIEWNLPEKFLSQKMTAISQTQ